MTGVFFGAPRGWRLGLVVVVLRDKTDGLGDVMDQLGWLQSRDDRPTLRDLSLLQESALQGQSANELCDPSPGPRPVQSRFRTRLELCSGNTQAIEWRKHSSTSKWTFLAMTLRRRTSVTHSGCNGKWGTGSYRLYGTPPRPRIGSKHDLALIVAWWYRQIKMCENGMARTGRSGHQVQRSRSRTQGCLPRQICRVAVPAGQDYISRSNALDPSALGEHQCTQISGLPAVPRNRQGRSACSATPDKVRAGGC
ncbi:hypothetical protein MAPG_09068 [Magnaporthiopsis poae ATCC 64411]|uniref:Uncharacterized protein n=1 Tax=Magnaporthiopsis poae (strain ATCC 64411 / 73-15) TaxID=644358 RepID=A0A0C4E8Z5_MAGP6|nr:hypothetical protein MAPG_09068 [Magnaporthiopsis poae ATCC 64411]